MHRQQQQPKRVAICFSGFVRNRTLTRSISDLWGVADYDAFLVGWRQHFELDVAPVVDSNALCRDLRNRGFRRCQSDLLDYDPAQFHAATSDRCLVEKKELLYPSRTASMFFGFARCMRAIREAQEDATSRRYDWAVMARLDLLDSILPCGTIYKKNRCALAQKQSSIWDEKLDLIVNRGPVHWMRVEDRLMIGRPGPMSWLEHAFANYTGDGIHGGKAEKYLSKFWRRYLDRSVRHGDTAEYFDIPSPTKEAPAVGFNPHRFSQCFFYRMVRALRLERSDLRNMVDRFSTAQRDLRCHPWVQQYANDSSVSCHVHDDNKANNLLVPGLREYEVLHPESVFVGARP